MPPSEEIILYHYTFSPYARRVVWYLNLRNIPYTQCIQPPILPRPTTKAIGTSYRRIPILSIGKDIYLDTRLILLKLSTLYPPSPSHPSLSSSPDSPFNAGIEKLLEIWTVHGLFARAASLIPGDTPLMRDERFRRDREDYMGVKGAYEEGVRKRAWGEAVLEVRNAFELLESTFLADGRDWVLGGDGPGMADIEAIWPFHWLTTLKGALPLHLISPTQFPKVFSWISRFDAAIRAAAKKAGKPKTVKGDEAVAIMRKAGYAEEQSLGVDEGDPSALKLGEWVEVWPTDSGSGHRDRGRLVGLSGREVVLETGGGEVEGVRVHAPRHGFRVRRVDGGKL
ncbi:hypothetical protein BKA64DRAFT_716358 [Cadophora sp. MPI-SDFR-AT-0126]|nr:hypothetical protein BKA64DRAFT_716358 [Leotiomycetes sp. MPI-SDFR-AT-0126]